MVFILLSSVQLAIENPLRDPDDAINQVLYVFDFIGTIVFSCEAIVKILAFGLLLNGP